MDSYYDEILKKIKDLMDEGKYAEANKLLEEELACLLYTSRCV